MIRNLSDILDLPTLIGNTHESVYRSYHILLYVLEMINRGDSKETINDIVQMLSENNDYEKEKQTKKTDQGAEQAQ